VLTESRVLRSADVQHSNAVERLASLRLRRALGLAEAHAQLAVVGALAPADVHRRLLRARVGRLELACRHQQRHAAERGIEAVHAHAVGAESAPMHIVRAQSQTHSSCRYLNVM
jgi:hypothetical protein